ncbi:MAG: hypothetical protein HYX55_04085 [Chloroflexi bacterium]|nr:hypothetical protein [Chloroflexota bacterium]
MDRTRALALALAAGMFTFGFAPADTGYRPDPTPILPDLAVLAPFDFTIEVKQDRRLLRFSTVLVNVGPGPFQLFGFDPDGVTGMGESLQVRQQILQSDGTFRTIPTTATMVWAADGHDHFHIADLQRIQLQNLQSEALRASAKTGFCFLDSYVFRSKEPSYFDKARFVCNVAPDRTVPMGISVQWGDVYRRTIAFQWIDITGLPDGDYLIEILADPPTDTGGQLQEADETNNRGWATIRLRGSRVQVLSSSPSP